MNKTLKISFVSFLVIMLSSAYCITILDIANQALEPYYLQAELSISESTIIGLIEDDYNSADFSYNNLDHLIGDYKDVEHIYRINFPHKMPLYAYVVSKTHLSTPVTYIVVFNSLGYIDNLIFANGYNELYDNSYLGSEEFVNSIIGQKAINIKLDSTASATASSDYIKEGLESAADNFIFEVKSR